jgi:hypothetical protein
VVSAQVPACSLGFFADFDTVQLVESAGEPVADRLLIHYRLHVTQAATRWVCTQTAVCKLVDGLLAVIDMVCSGLREVLDEHLLRDPALDAWGGGAYDRDDPFPLFA